MIWWHLLSFYAGGFVYVLVFLLQHQSDSLPLVILGALTWPLTTALGIYDIVQARKIK